MAQVPGVPWTLSPDPSVSALSTAAAGRRHHLPPWAFEAGVPARAFHGWCSGCWCREPSCSGVEAGDGAAPSGASTMRKALPSSQRVLRVQWEPPDVPGTQCPLLTGDPRGLQGAQEAALLPSRLDVSSFSRLRSRWEENTVRKPLLLPRWWGNHRGSLRGRCHIHPRA